MMNVILFESKILKTNSCWLWQGQKDKAGYGRYGRGVGSVLPHRIAYELYVGPIPEELTLDHRCRVRHCVNPAHLEPVTLKENIQLGTQGAERRAWTHCSHGHLLAGKNLLVRKNGTRRCLECNRQQCRRWYNKNEKRAA